MKRGVFLKNVYKMATRCLTLRVTGSFIVPTLPIHLVHTQHSTNYTHFILSIMPDTLTHLYDDGFISNCNISCLIGQFQGPWNALFNVFMDTNMEFLN